MATARVSSERTVAPVTSAGVTRLPLVPPERGSELALDVLRLDAGVTLDLADDLHDTLVFAFAGSGTIGGHALEAPGSGLLAARVPGALAAGPAGLAAVRVTVGAATDLHAPMGAAQPTVALEAVEPGSATGARSFQVMHGPGNGSVRATAFVGYVPPGKAPWHYHLYDEIVWVLRGDGRLHLGDLVEELAPGSAFRLHPREVHIVENVQETAELAVLGVFTPAGSPSAAYLEPGVAAS